MLGRRQELRHANPRLLLRPPAVRSAAPPNIPGAGEPSARTTTGPSSVQAAPEQGKVTPPPRPLQGTQAQQPREPQRARQGQERGDTRQEAPLQGQMTPPEERPPQGAQAQQPREPQRALQGQERGDRRAPLAPEQQRSGVTQQQPAQGIEPRQSRRSEHQERITPQAAVENRFAGQFLREPGRRDQWLAGRREHWAPGEAWRHKRRAVFVPWYGPIYWPYAYSDVFHYTFWPYAYSESYWAFAYDDFFDGIFFPYGAPYVANAYSGPYGNDNNNEQYDSGAGIYFGSPTRSKAQTAPPIGSISKAARQLCEKPDTGITAWPISSARVSIRRCRRGAVGTLRRERIETAGRGVAAACVRSGISGWVIGLLIGWRRAPNGARPTKGKAANEGKTRRLLSNRPGPNFDAESNSKRTATRQQLDLQRLLCNQTVEL
jgi:hypothetical protein